MLPPAAAFHFSWEISTGSVQEGESVRTFGRLVCYQPEESRATLSAQHASKEHHVIVHTMFVEPFNPIIGAQYIVLGETENSEVCPFCRTGRETINGRVWFPLTTACLCCLRVGHMVRARVLNCVDGVNIALLQKAINEQRSFFRERKCEQGEGDAT
ncbi:CST complex subunit TEN1 isoform X1 [Limanda limanda]|uniref:CST complex subunit TEN1 isoform X1 n=1 Tax=Limanda limanda TaxID=27771 RepID=UPI0029C69DC7|nr:CST complex subunit TEN1 isoform X1 [Limanda limanda]